MTNEYPIQRKLNYIAIGTAIASLVNPIYFLATTGIALGKAGRYIRRHFDEEFAAQYSLKIEESPGTFKKIYCGLKDFLEEYLEKNGIIKFKL